MKKILLIAACALLSPMYMLNAAEEAAATPSTTTSKAAGTKTAPRKTGRKKTASKTKKPRTKTTTAGTKKTKAAAGKTTVASKAKTPKARTKTTTAGTKAKTTKTIPKKAKGTTGSRGKKTTYGTKKAATTKAKRVYRKGGVTYRHFNHLNDATAQNLGRISKTTTQNIALNKPSKGYQTANHLTFTTPDGKKGQVVLDTHNITAKRAERKGFNASTHGQKSVEVFAGTDATGEGLALIGEYPITSNNMQISVNPNGQVTLAGAGRPIEFSIHQ